MGKRALKTQADFKPTPTVRLADKTGSRFVGKFVQARSIKIDNGTKNATIYEFGAVEGDALITVKDGNTFREADVNPGDTVTVFGSKAIDIAMAQVNPGETVEIIFNGQKKLRGGRRFNDYAVAVLEEEAN